MSTVDRVRQFIESNFYVADPSNLGNDQSLIDSGVVDSTGVLEIVNFVESEFGFKMNDAEIVPENVDSVNRIAAFVDARTATHPRA